MCVADFLSKTSARESHYRSICFMQKKYPVLNSSHILTENGRPAMNMINNCLSFHVRDLNRYRSSSLLRCNTSDDGLFLIWRKSLSSCSLKLHGFISCHIYCDCYRNFLLGGWGVSWMGFDTVNKCLVRL